MKHTLVVGLEVHVQLDTQTKLFCGCVNRFNPDEPNTQTCPVCLGLPGALPVLNETAFRLAVRTAIALNCQIAGFTKWDRKQYYYPDLPKAYQISQYDLPFSHSGWLEFEVEDGSESRTRVRLNRVHLEEDAGKNLHDETGHSGQSLVDLNRAGTPLMEIVSEPDIHSSLEARRYLEELRLLLSYLGVSDCNMQEGSLRCDANVNLHVEQPDGTVVATPIVEIKNMNSFRAVEAALDFEQRRQLREFEETGRRIGESPKSTRGWDADRNRTFAMRSKEDAADYRYFPDPDLTPVTVDDEVLSEIRDALPEMPSMRRERFMTESKLSSYDAGVIIDQGREFADYFEVVSTACDDPKQAANWLTQDVLRELGERRVPIGRFAIESDTLGALLSRITSSKITIKSGREIFTELLKLSDAETSIRPADIDRLIDEMGLEQVSDSDSLRPIIESILAENSKIVEDFRGGKQGAIGPLIGQAMKQLKGADPKTVRQMMIDLIES